jgi:DNA-binding CsgD family transcriptional regulator
MKKISCGISRVFDGMRAGQWEREMATFIDLAHTRGEISTELEKISKSELSSSAPSTGTGGKVRSSAMFSRLVQLLRQALPEARVLLLEVDPHTNMYSSWRARPPADIEIIEAACLKHFRFTAGAKRIATQEYSEPPGQAPANCREPTNCCVAFHAKDHQDGLVYIIAAMLSRKNGIATPDDTERLSAIAVDLAEIVFRTKRFNEAQLRLALGSPVAESLPWGIAAIGASGRIGFINRRGQRLLQGNRGVRIANGHLQFHHAATARTFRNMLTMMVGGQVDNGADARKHYALPVTDQDGRVAYALRLVPHETDECGPAVPAALTYITDLSDKSTAARPVLAATFMLSGKEAQLAELFGSGCDLDTVAKAMGISRNTARIHLSHVLDKTGARNQVELARLLARLPTDAGTTEYLL